MRIVLDTNVLVSGAFFGGLPGQVVDACVRGRVKLIVSPEIWLEYERVGREFTESCPTPMFSQLLALLATRATMVRPASLDAPVCRDPDDDMFVACALAAGADCIVSGDKDLLVLQKTPRVQVLSPRAFLTRLKSV